VTGVDRRFKSDDVWYVCNSFVILAGKLGFVFFGGVVVA
jgi:hypothetical protein